MSLLNVTTANAGRISAAIYTSLSLAAGGAFLAVTLATGDYGWVARIGGAVWVFTLTMIILMPTVTPWVRARASRQASIKTHQKEETMAKDVVCGMEVDPETTALTSKYNGQTYYFCSLNCKKSFDAEPGKYAAKPS